MHTDERPQQERGRVTVDALQIEGLDNGEPLPTQPPHNGVWVVVPCSYSGARTLTLVRATFGWTERGKR